MDGRHKYVYNYEVGYMGFRASSMASFLKEVGIIGGERNGILNRIGDVAEIRVGGVGVGVASS